MTDATPVDPRVLSQLAELRKSYPSAKLSKSARGPVLSVEIPLKGGGWNADRATVATLIPCGYPFAMPSHFWIDENVSLPGGSPPLMSERSSDPFGQSARYCYYRPQMWHPNRETLLTWIHMIQLRFQREGAGEFR